MKWLLIVIKIVTKYYKTEVMIEFSDQLNQIIIRYKFKI